MKLQDGFLETTHGIIISVKSIDAIGDVYYDGSDLYAFNIHVKGLTFKTYSGSRFIAEDNKKTLIKAWINLTNPMVTVGYSQVME